MTTVHTPAETADALTAPRPRSRRRIVKRVLAATVLTLGAAAAGGYFWLDATADVKVAGTPDCAAVTPAGTLGAGQSQAHQAVCATLSAVTDAWGRGDADAYGAQFTEDATYITYAGTYYEGRRDIAEGHRALFGGFVKGTELATSYLGIRFHGPDTAIVTTRGDTYEGESAQPGDLAKIQTFTLVRGADDAWRIAAFHNTARQRVMERISFLVDSGTRPAAEK
ncbi:SgcJ/EcaC family oxidoreductase [Streptomyces sp. MUM 203J]|uniref:SgcJ/EcaC family oxidoreductase n=1 Tax=Streptomyces sp. MUM 203J TaxID=2791990 RepID=UPI001F0461A6|nr:SgcJ/EcaC family oxidoreductase [Streptomyces sp. MUM 203J]MCH0543332.1 SgcJ/EcaC family oxidoreductase [Streptomyces sp. MUM 203J]